MQLREYLFYSRITAAEFSRMIGYDDQYVRLIVGQRKRPGVKMCNIIAKITNNHVSFDELRNAKISPAPKTVKNNHQKNIDETSNTNVTPE